ncbi:MAG TPA: riboflavin synthase [Candidatus Dormibacteraeota bacterium]|nr:riboflavin synthase [Candidatus Dormibacteraeota bacterium]
MFSGIVEELGVVARNAIEADGRLHVAAREVLRDVAVGDSIAVNGCCLTVVEATEGGFVADVMPETARRTNLGRLQPGDAVNLEAALRMGDRIGGHLVSGHVDAVGTVAATEREDNAVVVRIDAPQDLLRYVVEKGCITVDGISLTVVEAMPSWFSVSLIPHTLAATRAGEWRPGTQVNLEADLVAKYVEKGLAPYAAPPPPAARQEGVR